MSVPAFVRVIRATDVPESGNMPAEAFGRSILVCNVNGTFYAVDNECSHQRRPLAGGRVRGTYLFCPVHGARYDLRTGVPAGELTRTAIRTYPTRVRDGWVEIAENVAPDAAPP